MVQKVFVPVAWPYVNGDLHHGHIAGAYLPADIFARYHRLAGHEVLMVSGSDSHGTPITVRADKEGTTPRAIFERYHRRDLETFKRLGISFDLFTHTDTENHHKVAQDIFLELLNKGYLYRAIQRQLYSVTEGRFLPDRYVEGTCPICGYPHARGDQCENCGNLLDAVQLINPRSKNDGSIPEIRETEHYFLDLGKLSDEIKAYLSDKDYWRPNVIRFARNYVDQGLEGRPITRDLEWGIPVPVPGWENKRLYVWFEAVMGYLSAAIEWAQDQGQPDAWREWWYDPAVQGYYFIGKDNIPFHAVIWPAELIGIQRLYSDHPASRLNLPYDIPANEYMNLGGAKASKSLNRALYIPDLLERFDPDPLRYYIASVLPETHDTDFSWDEFVAHNNNELVATWGNLVNRVLTFTRKNYGPQVPEPAELDERDRQLLSEVESGFETIGNLIAACKFKAGLEEGIRLASLVNKYLDDKGPWFTVKTDRATTATTLFVALQAIDSLKVLLAPYLPFTAERLHDYLGYDVALFGEQRIETFDEKERSHAALIYDPAQATGKWEPSQLPPGQPLREPERLFTKLDERVAEEEKARLGLV